MVRAQKIVGQIRGVFLFCREYLPWARARLAPSWTKSWLRAWLDMPPPPKILRESPSLIVNSEWLRDSCGGCHRAQAWHRPGHASRLGGRRSRRGCVSAGQDIRLRERVKRDNLTSQTPRTGSWLSVTMDYRGDEGKSAAVSRGKSAAAFNLRPAGGWPPCGFSKTAKKKMAALRAAVFACLISHHFRTFSENIVPRPSQVRLPGKVKWPYLLKRL